MTYTLILYLFFLAIATQSIYSLKHHLTISDDDRDIFKIETFGFIEGGKMKFKITDVGMKETSKIVNKNNKSVDMKMGFIMRHASSESEAQEDIESIIEEQTCILDDIQPNDYVIDLSDQKEWNEVILNENTIQDTDSIGMYSLIFARCAPGGSYKVSFKLDAEFSNPGPSYLSAGDKPLPLVYFLFFILFSAALGVWVWVLTTVEGHSVHRIHYMMASLLVLKCFTLLFESIRMHYVSVNGTAEAWSIVYYIFSLMKGIMLFTVILLIGSGWSLMKPYLNDREKKIVMVVLTLQVLDNIAMIIIEETSPGSQDWLAWRDVLHLVDIICCCAILFPIVWSIKHLRQAAEADGKASVNLQKLQLFRTFYVMVVSYIYFTRIIVYLLSAIMPFYMLWLGEAITELATLAFYIVTGYKFRPAINNPYLPVNTEENEQLMEEFGLEVATADDDSSDNSSGVGNVAVDSIKLVRKQKTVEMTQI